MACMAGSGPRQGQAGGENLTLDSRFRPVTDQRKGLLIPKLIDGGVRNAPSCTAHSPTL
jgi:hypothetical protein